MPRALSAGPRVRIKLVHYIRPGGVCAVAVAVVAALGPAWPAAAQACAASGYRLASSRSEEADLARLF